jgi:hypothetical protein
VSLTVVLSHPDAGVIAPAVTGGSLTWELDRYPRMGLEVTIRPDPSPGGVPLWSTPYGTTAQVLTPGGSLLFTGPVYEARVARPSGAWTLRASDPIRWLQQWRESERPEQFLAGTTMDVPSFIRALAARAGVADRVRVSGSGGLVDVRALDLAGKDGWALVEEQLIANDLDVWPAGDGTLVVGPTARMGAPTAALRVGEVGTVVGYDVQMRRRINRVVLTHQCQKDGEDDRYVDGVWQDAAGTAGVASVGPAVYTRTVRVGQGWWADPAARQAQADANAAAVAQTVRGVAREGVVEAIPEYTLAVGATVDVTFLKGVQDRFLVTGIEWPVLPGPMRVTCRNPEPGAAPSRFLTTTRRADARLHP